MSLLVGICGGSGSGKTTLADHIAREIDRRRGRSSATVFSFDSYYHDQLHLPVEERARVNYDHPDSLDGELLAQHLRDLQRGRAIAVPTYDFSSHCRSDDLRLIDPADVVIVEGILLFCFPEVLEQLDFTVFRQCPEDVRFERRIQRDVTERGRSPESVRAQLMATVKPMHDRYVEPFGVDADCVITHGTDLDKATTAVVDRLSGMSRTAPDAAPH